MDRYTKFVLTVIGLALVALVVRPSFGVKSVGQEPPVGKYRLSDSMPPFVLDTQTGAVWRPVLVKEGGLRFERAVVESLVGR